MKERLLGLVALVSGGLLGYLCIYAPLDKAARNEPEISIFEKGAMLCPGAVVMGILLLALGPRVNKDLLDERRKPNLAGWIVVIVLFIAGFALYWWLETRLAEYGYHDK